MRPFAFFSPAELDHLCGSYEREEAGIKREARHAARIYKRRVVIE